MSEDFKFCRHGDVVEGRGTFNSVRQSIEWDSSTIRIVRPMLDAGDQVEWRDSKCDLRVGTVVAVDREPKPGTTYVWVREDGKWPRVTVDADQCRRIG